MAVSGSLDFLKVDYMETNESRIYPLTNGYGPRYVEQVRDFSAGIIAMNNPIIVPYISGIKMTSPVS